MPFSKELRQALTALGAEIRKRREAAGLSLDDATAQARNWGRIERAEIDPTLKELERIATALGAPLHEILKAARL